MVNEPESRFLRNRNRLTSSEHSASAVIIEVLLEGRSVSRASQRKHTGKPKDWVSPKPVLNPFQIRTKEQRKEPSLKASAKV